MAVRSEEISTGVSKVAKEQTSEAASFGLRALMVAAFASALVFGVAATGTQLSKPDSLLRASAASIAPLPSTPNTTVS